MTPPAQRPDEEDGRHGRGDGGRRPVLHRRLSGQAGLAICSISDNLVLGTELTPEERQTTFTNMMKIGLEAAVKMARQD